MNAVTDRPCGYCPSLGRECGWYCAEHGQHLRTGADGLPVKCFDCIETNNPAHREPTTERNEG